MRSARRNRENGFAREDFEPRDRHHSREDRPDEGTAPMSEMGPVPLIVRIGTIITPSNRGGGMGSRYLYGILLGTLLVIAIGQVAAATTAAEWNNQGIALSNQSNYVAAIEAYDNAIALDPMVAIYWYNKGSALKNQRKYPGAIEAYDRATALDPTVAVFWNDEGTALSAQGSYSAAIEAYDTAIALDPADSRPWYNKGVVHERRGNHTAALEAFDRAIALDPDDPYARGSRALSLAALQGTQAPTTTPAAGLELPGLIALVIGAVAGLAGIRNRGRQESVESEAEDRA